MDFDDLLVKAVQLLNEHPDVCDKWRSRYSQMLVDEFQDTNRLQLDLVSLLASGSPPNICVVGDDDQSIYGWRGAEVSNILEFENTFPIPRSSVSSKTTAARMRSFRLRIVSSKTTLDAVERTCGARNQGRASPCRLRAR